MTTRQDAPRARPQTARRRPAAPALARSQGLGGAITRASTLKPLEPLPELRPDPHALGLHAQFDVDVRLIDWQKTRISANDRLDKFEKNKRTQVWVTLGAASVRRAQVEALDWARIVVYVRFPNNIRREVSNLQPTAKGIVDGFIDAGLLPDDRDEMLDGPDMRRLYPNGPHRVVVQVWRKAC